MLKTKLWIVDKSETKHESYPQLVEASMLLKQGEVVAFPTETVYGLGADATSDQAVDKIFSAKGRPSDNPLIVHIAEQSQLDDFIEEVPDHAVRLMEAFWPGPLTIILKKKEGLSDKVTAGLSTVGVRMPDHPIALALIKEANLPIAAPSANLSGKPSPTTAQHVIQDLDGRVSGIVDGGATGVGVESTVVDCTTEIPVIFRPGGVTREQLESVVGEVLVDPALLKEGEAPKSPGMKYTHYAPDAPLLIVDGSKEFLQKKINEYQQSGKKVGVLTTDENKAYYQADQIICCGKREDLATVAHDLYHVLRSFNEYDVDTILSESFPVEGVGQAIMNRLIKAAGHHVISE